MAGWRPSLYTERSMYMRSMTLIALLVASVLCVGCAHREKPLVLVLPPLSGQDQARDAQTLYNGQFFLALVERFRSVEGRVPSGIGDKFSSGERLIDILSSSGLKNPHDALDVGFADLDNDGDVPWKPGRVEFLAVPNDERTRLVGYVIFVNKAQHILVLANKRFD
jgi:hypothetical protein